MRIYYYNENCTLKGQVAGTLELDSFVEFDALRVNEQSDEVGFAVGDCGYFEGNTETITKDCKDIVNGDFPVFYKLCAENCLAYLG